MASVLREKRGCGQELGLVGVRRKRYRDVPDEQFPVYVAQWFAIRFGGRQFKRNTCDSRGFDHEE